MTARLPFISCLGKRPGLAAAQPPPARCQQKNQPSAEEMSEGLWSTGTVSGPAKCVEASGSADSVRVQLQAQHRARGSGGAGPLRPLPVSMAATLWSLQHIFISVQLQMKIWSVSLAEGM